MGTKYWNKNGIKYGNKILKSNIGTNIGTKMKF